MKSLPAAKYNCKASFGTGIKSNDGYNTTSHQHAFYKWVNIQTGAAKELEQSGQLMGEITHTITCRYSNKIIATHQISYKQRLFEIIGTPVNQDFANVQTIIAVKELTHA
ncbi:MULTISPECIES: phage head closure protein [unclassified Pseudoalteromonas]|uniref:phage head closure protein n=1 Tax=unclassified Pseudoalteromonas TaxID=194690 RepID=UPI00041A2D39|nr:MULTISPECIES: phage head closure protein [unclassified Pseudoalteromonas]